MRDVVLGIGAFGHDASAAIVDKQTGEVIYATEEERLNNVKHSGNFPIGGVHRCEETAKNLNLTISDIAVNFDETEFIKGTLFDEIRSNLNGDIEGFLSRILDIYQFGDYYSLTHENFSTNFINSELSKLVTDEKKLEFLKLKMHWYYNWAIKYRNIFQVVCNLYPDIPVHRVTHHLSHAASAFFNSGMEKATIITVDGQGESETLCIYVGDKEGIRKVSTTRWPYSLGNIYLNVTKYLGFVLGDEYKVMGMAAYGKPKYYDVFKNMVRVEERGNIVFNETEYFGRQKVKGLYGHFYYNFKKLLVRRRYGHERLRQKHFDLACSVQKLIEDVGVEIAKKAIRLTKIKNLALAGGVALNGLMNEKIRLHSGCDRIFIYPAAGDDGTAVGAAQYVAFKHSKFEPKLITTCFYGYASTTREIEVELKQMGLVYKKCSKIHEQIAKAIANNEIVARYTGRSEFGPRALGNRSILANPHNANMKDTLNRKIKQREPFRPFAPACLAEHASKYFEIEVDAPFMLLIPKVKVKTGIAAVVHNDDTARVQTVSRKDNEDFYRIIEEFKKITGIPVLINTSFNVNGEAIVDNPRDAIESFGHMDIDYLAIGDYWVRKEDNKDKFPRMCTSEFLEIRRKRYLTNYDHILKHFNMRHYYFISKIPCSTCELIGKRIRGFLFRIFRKLRRFIS